MILQRVLTVSLLLLITYTYAYSQVSSVIHQDDFSDNETGWRLLNGREDQSEIKNGKLRWKRKSTTGAGIYNYFNLINDKLEYSAEADFSVLKPGSEYGFMIGTDQENAVYCLIKNMKYRIVLAQKGKGSLLQDPSTSFKVKPTGNTLKVVVKGNTLGFYSNDNLLSEVSIPPNFGKAVGFALWENSSVDIKDFVLKGAKLPINVVPNLAYEFPAENLGDGVNTQYGELTPVVTPDGRGLYFTRTYSPDNIGGASDYQDVYYSRYIDGKWSKAKNIGAPVNNDAPNAVCSVTPDGNTLLLMNTYDAQGTTNSMGVSMSRKTKDGWSVPENLQIRNYYNKSTFNEYFLSNDKQILLLALERDDTEGSRDIYVSFKEGPDNIWSTPKNLGSIINTPGTELSPFLAADNSTLYFSSTGHPGYGKNDIFITRRLDDSWTNWSEPQNLGEPVNSKGMDAYYSIPASGEYAYFVSEENSIGKSDIMRIKLPVAVKPKPTVLVYGRVLNSKTKEPISTGITYRILETDKEVGIAHSDPEDGSYKISLPYDQVYTFFAEKHGFYSVRDSISVPKIKEYMEIERDIYLTPLEPGEDIPLRNVFFVRSQDKLLPTSFPELDKLVAMLKDNPTVEIELGGHTDGVGSAEGLRRLSERRVETVVEYLVSNGISKKRVTGKGYGGSKPIAPNDTEENRRKNRRVEFKIVSM
ncbi:OmpA family protein [Cytophagaceae bacterium ABcell3]|nr:OmpA family protein [Cytophagaceae bacterium ABcell3]